MSLLIKTLLTLFILSPSISFAHPVSYEGGFSLMSETSPLIQEASFIYSPKWYLGTGIVLNRRPDQFNLTSLQVGYLLKRWNAPSSQGNIYLFGGPGYADFDATSNLKNGIFYRYGVRADYETRRIFSLIQYTEARLKEENKKFNDQLNLALGFAPYKANFDELNAWVIFKFQTDSSFETQIFTPTLRFFYKNFFWELGQDFDGNTNVNFMVRI